MTFPRFFCPGPLVPGAVLALPDGAAAHAARVLRLAAGSEITLFDGGGDEYAACIAAVQKGVVEAEVRERRQRDCESPLFVRLVQALQAGDKMDLTVQKAVELGVAAIQPVTSRRGVVRLDGERAVRRVAHWQGVAVSACEQCGRNRVPQVAAIEPLERWLARPAEAPLRLMLSPTATLRLRDLPPARSLDLLIGAEGGFDPREEEMAAAAGFIGVRLGPRVLRTETAGLAALAAIQTLWGDFGEEGENVRIG